MPRKVDGEGFLSQISTLKTVPSEKKSNSCTQKGVKCLLRSVIWDAIIALLFIQNIIFAQTCKLLEAISLFVE